MSAGRRLKRVARSSWTGIQLKALCHPPVRLIVGVIPPGSEDIYGRAGEQADEPPGRSQRGGVTLPQPPGTTTPVNQADGADRMAPRAHGVPGRSGQPPFNTPREGIPGPSGWPCFRGFFSGRAAPARRRGRRASPRPSELDSRLRQRASGSPARSGVSGHLQSFHQAPPCPPDCREP